VDNRNTVTVLICHFQKLLNLMNTKCCGKNPHTSDCMFFYKLRPEVEVTVKMLLYPKACKVKAPLKSFQLVQEWAHIIRARVTTVLVIQNKGKFKTSNCCLFAINGFDNISLKLCWFYMEWLKIYYFSMVLKYKLIWHYLDFRWMYWLCK
jgi:hypothetical protein